MPRGKGPIVVDRFFPSAPLRVNSGGKMLMGEESNHLLRMTGCIGEETSRGPLWRLAKGRVQGLLVGADDKGVADPDQGPADETRLPEHEAYQLQVIETIRREAQGLE